MLTFSLDITSAHPDVHPDRVSCPHTNTGKAGEGGKGKGDGTDASGSGVVPGLAALQPCNVFNRDGYGGDPLRERCGRTGRKPSGPDCGRPWHVLRPGAAQYRWLRRPRPAGPRETIAASSPCPAMRETRSSYSSHAFPIPSVLHLSHFPTQRSRNQTPVGEQIFVVLSKTPRTRVRPGMGSQGGGIHAGAGQPSARHVARNRSARSRMRAT